MRTTPNLLLSVFHRRWSASLMMALVMWLGLGEQIAAQAPYADEQTPEGWAWARIMRGKEANLNDRCNPPALDRRAEPALDPRAENDARWMDDCRRISATFLVDVLTHEPWREQVHFFGVKIIGARIEGDIDLHNAKLIRALSVDQSRIENDINLDAARTDSVIDFSRSRVAGEVSADLLHGELSLSLAGSEFQKDVSLKYAKIDGPVHMDGATFDGKLDADSMQVGASLFMRSTEQIKASFKGVSLVRAKVIGEFAASWALSLHEKN